MACKSTVKKSKIGKAKANIRNGSTRCARALYPKDWKELVERFGQFGQKRRYTVITYFSNRLDVYSQKPKSLLHPFTRYSKGKFKEYRKPAQEEQKKFGGSWIAVFRKKTESEMPKLKQRN